MGVRRSKSWQSRQGSQERVGQEQEGVRNGRQQVSEAEMGVRRSVGVCRCVCVCVRVGQIKIRGWSESKSGRGIKQGYQSRQSHQEQEGVRGESGGS